MWVEKRGVTKGRHGRHGNEPGSGPKDQGVTLRVPRVPCPLPGRRRQPTMPTPEIVPEHLSVHRLARVEASGSKNPRAAGSKCGRPPPGPAVLWPSWPCRARYLGLVCMVWVFCHRTWFSVRPRASRRRPLGGSLPAVPGTCSSKGGLIAAQAGEAATCLPETLVAFNFQPALHQHDTIK